MKPLFAAFQNWYMSTEFVRSNKREYKQIKHISSVYPKILRQCFNFFCFDFFLLLEESLRVWLHTS